MKNTFLKLLEIRVGCKAPQGNRVKKEKRGLSWQKTGKPGQQWSHRDHEGQKGTIYFLGWQAQGDPNWSIWSQQVHRVRCHKINLKMFCIQKIFFNFSNFSFSLSSCNLLLILNSWIFFFLLNRTEREKKVKPGAGQGESASIFSDLSSGETGFQNL